MEEDAGAGAGEEEAAGGEHGLDFSEMFGIAAAKDEC